PDHLRCACVAFVLEKLEAWNDLGTWDRAHPQPGAASMVLHVDSAARGVAACAHLVRFFHHALRLLPLLERAALRFALAFRAMDARDHNHSNARCRGLAGPAKTGYWREGSVRIASAKSGGIGASNFIASPVRGWRKASF